MDYANLNSELEVIGNTCKQGLNTLNNLNLFFKSYYKYSELFCVNTLKNSENLFNDQLKQDNKSSLSKSIFDFFRNYESLMIKFKNTMQKLEKDIIEPLSLFYSHIGGIYQETINEFKNIINTVHETKRNLGKTKQKYFDYCKLAQEQEKLLMKIVNEKEKKRTSNDEEISFAHDTLLKYRSQAENNSQLYKYELIKANKCFEECDKKYMQIKEKIRNNEEGRVYFIKCHLEKFGLIIAEINTNSNDFSSRLNFNIQDINIEDDLKLLNEKNKYLYEGNIRFPREDFLNYDIFRRNAEVINASQSQSTHSNSEQQTLNSSRSDNDDFEIINSDQYSENYHNRVINELLKNIYLEKETSTEEIGKIIELIQGSLNVAQLLIDKIIFKEKKNLFIKFANLNNLHHFANILNTITLTIDDVENEFFDLNFAIIYIAERTYFSVDNVRKLYLCALLSKNKLYSTRKFWIELIDIKINRKIEDQVKNLSDKAKQTLKEDYNSNSKQKNPIFGFADKFKNFFNPKEKPSPRSQVKDSISHLMIDKIKVHEATNVLNECIPHFANFNFAVSEAIDIIVEFGSKYHFPKEKISYFVSKLNSNNFTIKNKVLTFKQSEKEKADKANLLSRYNKYYDSKFASLAVSVEFLKPLDYVNLMLLNKNYYNKLSRIFFKSVLLKNSKEVDFNLRYKIWSNILRIDLIKKENNYRKIIEEIEDVNNLSVQTAVNDLILLDIQRTSFESDVEQNRNVIEMLNQAIFNILKAVAYKKPSINYSQGMNYIAAFIYLMTKSEEETFYFFMAFMEKTEYSSIYVDELSRLKQFFYVMERLMYLYLPEIFNYFRSHQIIVSYYSSPWFITLFTNAYQYLAEKENPKVIIRIWDEFLLNGWKSIMKNGLILLKHNESSLLQFKYEDMLQFLINDCIRLGFFENKNFNNYIRLNELMKVKPGLINNLENEYIQENKYKELEEKKFQEQKSKLEKLNAERENTIKI